MLQWLKAQSDYTNHWLNRTPGRDSLAAEFAHMDDIKPAEITDVTRKNNRYFLKKHPPEKKQASCIIGKVKKETTSCCMRKNGFRDSLTYGIGEGRIKGQVFIHELTHAWQIKNTHWELGILADALANKICEATKGSDAPYVIGNDFTKPFSEFNLEQQAKIVELWFVQCESLQSGKDDISSPFYHYIEGNIRAGRQ